MVRDNAGIQISVAKKACSWRFCREYSSSLRIHFRHHDSFSNDDAVVVVERKTFGRCSEGLVRHTRLAHHTSIPQLTVLVKPMTTTPTNIELDKITREIKTGAKSLHRRSILRVTALRCVSVYDDCLVLLA